MLFTTLAFTHVSPPVIHQTTPFGLAPTASAPAANTGSTTNPFLTNTSASAFPTSQSTPAIGNGLGSLHQQFGGLQMNQISAGIGAVPPQQPQSAQQWNWSAAPQPTPVAANPLAAFSNTTMPANNFANPFMNTGPSLVTAGGPVDNFAQFASNGSLGGSTSTSSLDNLSWGFASAAPSAAASAQSSSLWQ